MIRNLTMIYAYYNNPVMLAEQYSHWVKYSSAARRGLQIIVVDDGSQQKAVDVIRPPGLPPLRILRIHEDWPWHQNAARNLGAQQASTDWLLLTDMDHVFPSSSIEEIHTKRVRPEAVYKFRRFDVGTMKPTLDKHGQEKPHPNSYLMARSYYWSIGGYDERTCGYYGTDSIFRAKIERKGTPIVLLKVPVLKYTDDNIPGATTQGLARKQGRPLGWRRALLEKLAATPPPEPCKFHWYEEELK